MACNVLALFALAGSARILIYLEKPGNRNITFNFLIRETFEGEPSVKISVEQKAIS